MRVIEKGERERERERKRKKERQREREIKRERERKRKINPSYIGGGGGIRPPFRFFALFSKNLPYNIW